VLTTPPRIGISRCLLGDEVRFDGGHKRDSFLTSTFGRFVEWVPVCPEVEIGMGIPREAIHLVARPDGVPSGSERVRLLGVVSDTDWTSKMSAYASKRVRDLQDAGLSGYVLKKDSPSCGLERVRVKHASADGSVPRGGMRTRTGRGLFAEALVQRLPNLPIEEEGRLNDPALRENFVERVFAYQRVRTLFAGRWNTGALVRFHTQHKLQLLAHSRAGYATLGRLVAGAKGRPPRELAADYERLFMETLSRLATPGRHADVMTHMAGHLKKLLDAGDRAELAGCIDDHRKGLIPLVVPVTLLRHHVRRHDVAYLREQSYLDPHPRELSLRNHV
jgi:uncharacterized protein YbgA (DUF1722 family)/uncharacterized protein YbbK (DUF523 family)